MRVRKIAEHLQLECSDLNAASVAAYAKEMVEGLFVNVLEALTADGAEDPLAREDSHSVDAAIDGMSSVQSGRQQSGFVVTRRLFFGADKAGAPLQPIDATGRQRLLVFGPYVFLPPADWTVRCVYGFSPEMVGIEMSVDVGYERHGFRQLTRTSFTVTSQGRLNVNVRFLHTDPSGAIEVRLFCERPVFDGQVSIGFAEFRRNDPEEISEICFANLPLGIG